MADRNLERMASHGIRRAAEMREVAKTLEDMGVEPLMTRGTIERQQRTGDAKLKDAFGGKVPEDRARDHARRCASRPEGRARLGPGDRLSRERHVRNDTRQAQARRGGGAPPAAC